MAKGLRGGKRKEKAQTLAIRTPSTTLQPFELARIVENVDSRYFGDYADKYPKRNIQITSERLGHIKSHHENEYRRLWKNLDITLKEPDTVIEDKTGNNKIVFIRRTNQRTHQLVVVQLGRNKHKVRTSFSKTNNQLVNYLEGAKILYVRGG